MRELMNPDVCFILPGNLEALTQRGGGREERLVKIALTLSRYFNIFVISPFFGKFRRISSVYQKFFVLNVYFPAHKKYPPQSEFTKFMRFLATPVFELLATVELVRLMRKGLRIVIVSDVMCLLPAFVAKLLRVKIVWYEGNLDPWITLYIPKKLVALKKVLKTSKILSGRLLGKLSDVIVVNDGITRMGMKNRGLSERSKIHVLRGAVDTGLFKPSMKRSSEVFTVGFVGRLTEEKGAHLLLDLCKKAMKELPQVSFVILGNGPYRKRLEDLPNVKFVGQVAHSSIPKMLSSVDVILSFQKTFGMAEVEALSCGVPVVAARIGEMPILVEEGKTGLLCELNVGSYLKALNILINDEALLRKLSIRARKEAIKKYDWNVRVKEWMSVLKSLAKIHLEV